MQFYTEGLVRLTEIGLRGEPMASVVRFQLRKNATRRMKVSPGCWHRLRIGCRRPAPTLVDDSQQRLQGAQAVQAARSGGVPRQTKGVHRGTGPTSSRPGSTPALTFSRQAGRRAIHTRDQGLRRQKKRVPFIANITAELQAGTGVIRQAGII